MRSLQTFSFETLHIQASEQGPVTVTHVTLVILLGIRQGILASASLLSPSIDRCCGLQ